MNRMEDAFADEVLAEIARQRGVTAKDVYTRAGITQSTWGNYFVQRTTRIPLRAMIEVSDALGVLPEEMMRRARLLAESRESDEAPAPMTSAEVAEHALSQVSPEAQEAIRAFKRADAVGSEGADDGPGSVAN